MSKDKVTKSTVTAPTIENQPDFFEKLGKNGKWFVLGLLTIMACVLFRDFLTGKRVYLFKDIGSDTLNGILPCLADITRQTKEMMFPKWSFDCGMGSNIFPLMFRDPFDIIIYYSTEANVPYLIIVKELLKVILSGFLFFLFLKELSVRNFAATIGAIMFAFCGFMILGGGWYYFSFEGFDMALLLYGYEVFTSKKKWFWFVLGIFLIFISMPVNLIWHGLFLLSYILLRQYQKRQVLFEKAFFIDLGKLALLAVVGILLAGPFFLEVLQMILNSPRGSGDDAYYNALSAKSMFRFADANEFGTSMMRFFSSDIIGGGTNYKGYLNFLEAPMFYCGLPCLLLMPQAFGFLNKKTKTAFIIFISVWCFPIIFPYFRNAFWLFAGDYYRAYSFFVSLVFMLFSVIALDKIIIQQKINRTVLIVTGVIVFALSSYPYFKDKNTVDVTIGLFVKVFLLLYFFLLLFYIPKEKNRQSIQFVFLIAFVLEALFLSNITVNKRSSVTARELKEKVGYNDYSVEAVKYIKSIENNKSDFYRVEKNYFSSPAIHGSLNDGMVQDYKGTSCYHSFSPKNYTGYLRGYGVIAKGDEMSSRWSSGLINRPVLQSLNSVKYLIVKSYSNPLWHVTHDSLAQFGDVKVLRSNYNLPFGYAYDKYITKAEFDNLSMVQKDYISLQTAVTEGDGQGLAKFDLKDTIPANNFSLEIYKSEVNALKADTLVVSAYNNNVISGTIDCRKNELLCMSIPFDDGWHATVDGKDQALSVINSGHTGLFLPKGKHTVEMRYELVHLTKGIIMTIAGALLMLLLVVFRKKIFPQGGEVVA